MLLISKIRKSPSPMAIQGKRKSSYKLISYIGDDIEAKVNEHFRRSLGSKFTKLSNKLATIAAPSSADTTPESNKLVINENEDAESLESLVNDADNNLK